MANLPGDHDKLGNESRERFDVLLDDRFFEPGILLAVGGQLDNPGRSVFQSDSSVICECPPGAPAPAARDSERVGRL